MKRGQVFSVLQRLETEVSCCHKCPLSLTRKHTVFGAGNPEARLVVFGEGPGEKEDLKGEPFIGPAGILMTRALETIGLKRSDVYICNVVRCRACSPSEASSGWSKGKMLNRPPTAEEIKACRPFAEKQLDALPNKELILALGRPAAYWMLGLSGEELDTAPPMYKLRGRFYQSYFETPLVISYHPSYLLRSPKEKRAAYEDFKMVRRFLAGEIQPELHGRQAAEHRVVEHPYTGDPRRADWGKLKPEQKDEYSKKLTVI